MYHSLFIHSPVERHLGCFQFGTITDNSAIKIYVHECKFSFHLDVISRREIAGSYCKCMFKAQTLSKVAVQFHIPISNVLFALHPCQQLVL